MTELNATSSARPKLGVRTGASRKLLERKAAEKGSEAGTPGTGGLEALFSSNNAAKTSALTASATGNGDVLANEQVEAADATPPRNAPSSGTAAADVFEALGQPPAAAPPLLQVGQATPAALAATWSDEDEKAYQALLARRPTAARNGRSKAVADQPISVGSISPNPGTVIAVIVALVADHGGTMPRGELVTAMAGAAFPHPKAEPSDRGWCQGYVAGAIRNGFLTASAVTSALTVAA